MGFFGIRCYEIFFKTYPPRAPTFGLSLTTDQSHFRICYWMNVSR